MTYIYDPSQVDVAKCGHTTDEPHNCVHDWRVYWGNVDRTGDE